MAVSKLWKVTERLGQVIDYATNPEKTAKPEGNAASPKENAAPEYSSEEYQALKDVLAYAKDEEKTEREFFCEGINCNVVTAREQFVTVKEQYDKTDGIQAYHGYLSFKENEVTPEQAQRIGMEFANRMWGERFQAVVTTHLNTKHLHCHFVINSVSFLDGKRLQNKEKSWYYFRHIADEICLEHKLSIVENPKLHQSPQYLTKKDEAGMPTRYNNARKAIDEAVAMSHNLKQFQYELGVMGYQSNFNPNRKYATVTPKGSGKPIRTYRLGEDYTKERILERLIQNRDSIAFAPFQPKTYRVRQYRLPTREDKIKKVGGLYGLYLHYCYKLGYLPKYKLKQQNNARLHYLLKDDLMKLDEITAQTTLLGKHHIGDTGQLFLYQQSVESEIKTLTADRTHLRNKIRRVDITDERLSAAKGEIAQISEKLKTLRKEVKLCKGIAERSGDIKSNLAQALAEEEKLQRKENRSHDKRR